MDRIIFCVFLGEDLDVYRHLLPRYFPSADKYDQELESIELEEDADQEGNAEEEKEEEKEKEESHESEGEGKAAEKSDKEEETAGLFCIVDSKTLMFSLCFAR